MKLFKVKLETLVWAENERQALFDSAATLRLQEDDRVDIREVGDIEQLSMAGDARFLPAVSDEVSLWLLPKAPDAAPFALAISLDIEERKLKAHQKLAALRLIRALTGWGLRETRDALESGQPVLLRSGMERSVAQTAIRECVSTGFRMVALRKGEVLERELRADEEEEK